MTLGPRPKSPAPGRGITLKKQNETVIPRCAAAKQYNPGTLNAGKIYKKHETIALLKQAFSIDSNSAVMVGDTSGDIIAGKKNAISTAGVTWGYGTKDELVQSQCDILLSEKDFEQWL